MSALRRLAGLFLVVLVAASCTDSQPRGPGFVEVVVKANQPIGAAVVDLAGGEIESVEDAGGGWQALAEVPVTAAIGGPQYRLVLIREQAATRLSVRVRVPDVGGTLPVAMVVVASDGDDRPVANVASVTVEVLN